MSLFLVFPSHFLVFSRQTGLAASQRSAGSFTGFFKFKRLISNEDFLRSSKTGSN